MEINKEKKKSEKKKPKSKNLSGVDKLLAGSMDCEFLPDGRIVRKGKRKKGEGVKLDEHTFYRDPRSPAINIQRPEHQRRM